MKMTDSPVLPVTVLFIEDDVQLRTVLCEYLRRWAGPSMRCIEVATIDDALKAVQMTAMPEGHIDVIILDWSITGSNGFETIAALQDAMPPEQPTIPINVISGVISLNDGINAINAGADDFLQKGVGMPEAFVSMVRRSWARHQVYLQHFGKGHEERNA